MAEFTISENAQSTNGSQGYINTSYFGNQASEGVRADQAANQDEALLGELGQKLGVDPSTLTSTEVPEEQKTTTQEVPETEETEDFLKKFDSEDGKKFLDNFKQYTGIDIKEAYEVVQNAARLTAELDTWRGSIQRAEEIKVLQGEWGSDYDVIMPQVVERFKTLNPEQQRALDNVDGARMLAALVRQEKLGGNGNKSSYLPQGNVRSVSGKMNGGVPTIRMSDLIKWSGKEIDANMRDIQRAKAAGTFIYDI